MQGLEIKEFQKLIKDTYFHNDSERGNVRSFLYLMEEVGELAISLAKDDVVNLADELSDVVAWCFSLANVAGINMEDALAKKYPGGCQSCGSGPCGCEDKR